MAKKVRELSRLEKLSIDSLRRMGLDIGMETKQSLALSNLLKVFEKIMRGIEKRVNKKMNEKIAEFKVDIGRKQAQFPHAMIVSTNPGGVKSSPPLGSKKIRNLYITPEGYFHMDYEDA